MEKQQDSGNTWKIYWNPTEEKNTTFIKVLETTPTTMLMPGVPGEKNHPSVKSRRLGQGLVSRWSHLALFCFQPGNYNVGPPDPEDLVWVKGKIKVLGGWKEKKSMGRKGDCTSNISHRFHEFVLWDKCSDLVHWEDQEGWGGAGGGWGDRDGEYMYIQGWFMSMYDKKPLQYKKEKKNSLSFYECSH